MHYIVRLIKYHRRTIGALIFGLAFSLTIAYATPPTSPYTGGETLDPSCAPGDANCTVSIFPDQTGNAGEYLTTDGTTLSWAAVAGGSLIGSTSTLGTETWLGTSAADLGNASNDHTIFIGINTGKDATNAIGANFIGLNAGFESDTTTSANFIGTSAGYQASGAQNSVLIGSSAGSNASTISGSNFIGYQAGASATAGVSNFIGYQAGNGANTTPYSNFIGYNAGANSATSTTATFVGYYAGGGASNAAYSTFIGAQAGMNSAGASNSVFIGKGTGLNTTVDNTGDAEDFSIAIGPYASPGSFKNSIAMGGSAINTAENQFMIGSPTRAINQLVINGVNPYINFGATGGTSGYGFRDNAGTIQYKNSGGSWTAIGSGALSDADYGDITVSGTGTIMTIDNGVVSNTKLANSSVTINGTAVSLGASGTVTAAAGTLTGTTLNATVVSSSLTSLGTIATGVWQGTAIGDTYISSASTWNAKESALTFSTGLTRSTNTITSNLSTGVSGGQSVIGGTASGNSLTLSSTSNATKGSILFGSSSYSEANNTLGIGTTAGTTDRVTLADTTLAGSGSLAGSLISGTQTWNTTGAPTAWKLNVTNTASGAASLLMDLQVGGVSQFKVSKAGYTTQMLQYFGTSALSPMILPITTSSASLNTAGTNLVFYNRSGTNAASAGAFAFGGDSMAQTSGSVYTVNIPQYFAPTSGSATYAALAITGNVTQTGGANGITRGIYIAPGNLTVADYRALEIPITLGYGIYQSGASVLNYFAGNVGIGMTGASVALDVTGDIEYTGTITDVSDARLKDNITDFESGLAIVNAIGVKNYNMLASPEKVETGFIAQNVNEFFPQAVSIVDPVNGYMGVSYVSFIPVLTKAVQELDIKVLDIATLQAEQANAFGPFANSFFSEVLASVEGGIAYMRNIVVETIKIGSPDKRTGITMYDEVTGEPFCLSIANGSTKTVAGECGIIEHVEEPPEEEDVPIDTTEEVPADDESEDPIGTEDGDEQPPTDEGEDAPPQDLPADEASTDENPPVETPPAEESTPEDTPPTETPVTP